MIKLQFVMFLAIITKEHIKISKKGRNGLRMLAANRTNLIKSNTSFGQAVNTDNRYIKA